VDNYVDARTYFAEVSKGLRGIPELTAAGAAVNLPAAPARSRITRYFDTDDPQSEINRRLRPL
jgi:hypothetical protein